MAEFNRESKRTDDAEGDDELRAALEVALDARGVIQDVKAHIRAEAFMALNDTTVPSPPLCRENLILNELIHEYLAYNGYHHASSVLQAESGQENERIHRRLLSRDIGYPGLAGNGDRDDDNEDPPIPLLYSILAALYRGKEEDQKEAETHQARVASSEHVRRQLAAGSEQQAHIVIIKPNS